MLPFRAFLVCTLLTLAFSAQAGQSQPRTQDVHGDPLPQGAVARFGTVRFRHEGSILFAAFLPDGKRVSSVSSDGVISIWEFPSGKELRRFEATSAKERASGAAVRVTSLSMSPNGKYLTAFCNDGYLRIWDWASAKQLGKVHNAVGAASPADQFDSTSPFSSSSRLSKARARAAAALTSGPVYSPDGKTLMLVGSSGVLQFVDLPSGKEVGPSLGHTVALTAVSFTPDGKKVITKDSNSTHTWDVATGKDVGSRHLKFPANLGSPTIISPDGRFGVTVARFATPARARAADTREAVLFDTATGKELATIGLEVEVTPVHRKPIHFSPDSKWLVVGLDSDDKGKDRIALYAVPSGKLQRTLQISPAAAPAPQFGKGKGNKGGGRKGVGGGPGGGGPGGLGAPGGLGGFRSISTQKMLFSPDGKVIAFQAAATAGIVLLDTATGNQLGALRLEGGVPLLQGTFSPDGRCLVLRQRDGTVTFYEVATGQPRRSYGSKLPSTVEDDSREAALAALMGIDPPVSTRSSVGFALSPGGKSLAFANPDGTVAVVDVLTGKELAVFEGHKGAVNAVAFAPDGKTLASAGSDTTALLWDLTKIKRPSATGKAPRPSDLEAWWQVLGEGDAAKAFATMGDFLAAPSDIAAFLKVHLRPVAPLDRKHIGELLAQLDDKQYKVRERATGELLKIGEQVVPELDKTLTANPSPETKRRVEELRSKMTEGTLHGERLRLYRGVELLERLGTPAARQVLQALADGAPGALVTASAQAALRR